MKGRVFEQLAEDYRARPGYPDALLSAIAALAPGGRALEIGAGTGTLAAALVAKGLSVVCVEPALRMGALAPRPRLAARGEALPLSADRFDLVVLADAVQWLHPMEGPAEARRVLAPEGVIAIVAPRFAETPEMAELARRIREENPRTRERPPDPDLFLRRALPDREVGGVELGSKDPLPRERLLAVLRSFSHVGAARGAAGAERIARDLPDPFPFERTHRLRWARRGKR